MGVDTVYRAGRCAGMDGVDQDDGLGGLPGFQQGSEVAGNLQDRDLRRQTLTQALGDNHADGIITAVGVADADDEHGRFHVCSRYSFR